jgi:hypothetical protein
LFWNTFEAEYTEPILSDFSLDGVTALMRSDATSATRENKMNRTAAVGLVETMAAPGIFTDNDGHVELVRVSSIVDEYLGRLVVIVPANG